MNRLTFAVLIKSKLQPVLLSLAAVSASGSIAAPAKRAPTTPARVGQPTLAQVEAAKKTLGLMMSALNSKEVPNEFKGGLFGCLYQVPLGKISDSVTKTLAANKQINGDDPNQYIMVVGKVCGAPLPDAPASGSPPAGNSAKPGSNSSTGGR